MKKLIATALLSLFLFQVIIHAQSQTQQKSKIGQSINSGSTTIIDFNSLPVGSTLASFNQTGVITTSGNTAAVIKNTDGTWGKVFDELASSLILTTEYAGKIVADFEIKTLDANYPTANYNGPVLYFQGDLGNIASVEVRKDRIVLAGKAYASKTASTWFTVRLVFNTISKVIDIYYSQGKGTVPQFIEQANFSALCTNVYKLTFNKATANGVEAIKPSFLFDNLILSTTTNFVKPTAQSVTVSGNTANGSPLTGTYTYYDENLDTESGSTFKWYRCDNANGDNPVEIAGATALTYNTVATDADKYIKFAVTPSSNSTDVATKVGDEIKSSNVIGPILPRATLPTAPQALNPTVIGEVKIGQMLSAQYTYFDANNDAHLNTRYQWYRVYNGVATLIPSATVSTYVLTNSDAHCKMKVTIQPFAAIAPSAGDVVSFTTSTAVKEAIAFDIYRNSTAAPQIIRVISDWKLVDGVMLKKVVFRSRFRNESDSFNEIYAVMARPVADGVYPAAVWFHGGGGFAAEDKVKYWAKNGYASIVLDEPGIADPAIVAKDGSNVTYSKGYWTQFSYATYGRFTEDPLESFIYDGVVAEIEAINLLCSQPFVDATKVGVTGESWGGYSTTIVSGLMKDRIKASFSIYGCGFYDIATAFSTGSGLFGMTQDGAKRWLDALDGGRYAKDITSNFYMAAAVKDVYFCPPSVMATMDMIGGVNKTLAFAPTVGHRLTGIEGNENLTKFHFDYVLKSTGTAMPKVEVQSQTKESNGDIVITFKAISELPIRTAKLHKASMNEGNWAEHIDAQDWVGENAVSLGNNLYSATIPNTLLLANNYKYYVQITNELNGAAYGTVASYVYDATVASTKVYEENFEGTTPKNFSGAFQLKPADKTRNPIESKYLVGSGTTADATTVLTLDNALSGKVIIDVDFCGYINASGRHPMISFLDEAQTELYRITNINSSGRLGAAGDQGICMPQLGQKFIPGSWGTLRIIIDTQKTVDNVTTYYNGIRTTVLQVNGFYNKSIKKLKFGVLSQIDNIKININNGTAFAVLNDLKTDFKNELTLYPNPARDDVTLNLTKASKIEIFDSLGKKVYTENAPIGLQTISIREYTKGVYIVKWDDRMVKLVVM